MTMRRAALALTFVGIVAAGAAGAVPVTVSNIGSWDGSSNVYNWGHGGVTETYGQTITAPAGVASLDNFGFVIQDLNDSAVQGAPGPITYQANVYLWDSAAAHPTGAALYQSAVLTTPVTNTGAFIPTNFTTGGIPVTPGGQYILFLTTDGVPIPTDGSTTWAYMFADTYAGGAFEFLNDPSFADLATTAWTDSTLFGENAGNDLTFTATFSSAIPEPMGLMLFGGALACIGLARTGRST